MQRFAIPVLSMVLAGAATAEEEFDPAAFLAEKCSSCHEETVYTRPNRRVRNLEQLEAQVRRCDANLGTHLFDEDIEALVKHLDRRYYRFPR